MLKSVVETRVRGGSVPGVSRRCALRGASCYMACAWTLALLLVFPGCAGAQESLDDYLRRRDRERLVGSAKAHGMWLYDLCYLPKRNWVVSGGQALEVWDADTMKLVVALSKERTCYGSVKVSRDEKLLAVGTWSRKNHLQLYSLERRKLIKQFTGYTRGQVERIALSPDGKYLAAAAADDTGKGAPRDNATRVWEWRTGKLVLDVRDPAKGTDNMASSIAFNPRLPLFYEGCGNDLVAYDTRTWKEVKRIHGYETLHKKVPPLFRTKHTGKWMAFYNLTLSSDGRLLASRVIGTSCVLLFDAKTLRFIRRMEGSSTGLPLTVLKLAFSRDGRFLARCYKNLWIWDTRTGKIIDQLNNSGLHRGNLHGLAFNRTGEFLFCGGGNAVAKWRWRLKRQQKAWEAKGRKKGKDQERPKGK